MPLEQKEISQKSRLIAFLLAFFFGVLGVDRFYTGKIVTGIFKLLTIGGFGIWWLIDWIMILSGNYKDKWGKFIVNWEAKKGQLIAVCVIIGVCLLLYIVGSSDDKKTSTSTNEVAMNNSEPIKNQTKKVEAIKISAIQLYNEYEENEVLADEKYRDKIVDISGEVDEIGKDILDNPYVSLVTTKNSIMNLSMVQCSFDKNKIKELSSLKKGKNVVIRGEVKGSTATIVSVFDCELLK